MYITPRENNTDWNVISQGSKSGAGKQVSAAGLQGQGLSKKGVRQFSYLRFRKCQSRVWTNIKLVGGPKALEVLTRILRCSCSKSRPWNPNYENIKYEMAVQRVARFAREIVICNTLIKRAL